jgi:hydroxymethylpyrimidine/phosphomethylpyrimidine kinase
MDRKTARILIVAGSDSGGGAGIQADIKTVTMLGGHALTAVAAITAQNSRGVQAVHAVPTEMVLAQIESVVEDFGVDAVKIGMIGAAATAEAVAARLERLDGVPIVFDPVMVATSGSALADPATIRAFERFFARAALVTPNLPELAALGGLAALAPRTQALLVKGGHGPEDGRIVDRLYRGGQLAASWSDARIETPHTHGTGCSLASAIATGLGQGLELEHAIERARRFVRLALHDAPALVPKNGPLGHGRVRNDALTGPALNQMLLPCLDLERSRAFYRTLGCREVVARPALSYARFEAPNGVTFSIQAAPGRSGPPPADPPQSDGPGAWPAVLLCFEHDRLDAWCARLEAAGIRFDTPPLDQPWGWREARLRDPAGNPLCLYQAGESRRFP